MQSHDKPIRIGSKCEPAHMPAKMETRELQLTLVMVTHDHEQGRRIGHRAMIFAGGGLTSMTSSLLLGRYVFTEAGQLRDIGQEQ